MINHLNISSVDIWWMEIPQGDRGTRRAREKAAVQQLLAHCGLTSALGHLPSGMPVIEGVGCLSVAHSQRVAAIAVADFPMGIDVEEPRQAMLERVAEKFLTPSEFASLPKEKYLEAWTIKEAGFKAACAAGLHPITLLDIPLAACRATTIAIAESSLLTLAAICNPQEISEH